MAKKQQAATVGDSARADGRGHWPAGKRRHADTAGWARIRLALQTLLDNHFAPGAISAKALAEDIGVSDRTVRRWLAGEDRPAPERQELVAAWIAERRGRK